MVGALCSNFYRMTHTDLRFNKEHKAQRERLAVPAVPGLFTTMKGEFVKKDKRRIRRVELYTDELYRRLSGVGSWGCSRYRSRFL